MKLAIIPTAAVALLFLRPELSAHAAKEDEAVLQAERELALAYQKSDANGIMRGVMEDYTLTNSRGEITTRGNDIDEANRVDPKYEIFQNSNMKVRVQGDTAVVLGITHTKGISGGKPFDAQFQFTDTFCKDRGQWRLFAGHVTKLQPDSQTVGQETSIEPAELIRRTQELYDSVVSGNQDPWKKNFADDCIFADEKDRMMDKAKLVADITPLPAGYSGSIKIENPKSVVSGNTAVLSYELNESETIFGQKLSARYHITDTWLRRNNNWQIVASQAHRYYEDPAIGESDPKKFADFIGTYELAPGQTRTVSTKDKKLFTERKGKEEELLPETSDLFFRKGVEGRILFRHDNRGRVTSLVDRRNNEDVVWRKIN